MSSWIELLVHLELWFHMATRLCYLWSKSRLRFHILWSLWPCRLLWIQRNQHQRSFVDLCHMGAQTNRNIPLLCWHSIGQDLPRYAPWKARKLWRCQHWLVGHSPHSFCDCKLAHRCRGQLSRARCDQLSHISCWSQSFSRLKLPLLYWNHSVLQRVQRHRSGYQELMDYPCWDQCPTSVTVLTFLSLH